MATIGHHKLAQDKGLMWRMYMTMFLMGILYAVFVLILWSSGVGIIFVAVIAGVIMGTQYFMSEKLILRSTGAKEVPQEQEPELYAMVERLAQIAEMPMPKLAVIDSPVPNAFATGRNPQNALVAVTTGIPSDSQIGSCTRFWDMNLRMSPTGICG